MAWMLKERQEHAWQSLRFKSISIRFSSITLRDRSPVMVSVIMCSNFKIVCFVVANIIVYLRRVNNLKTDVWWQHTCAHFSKKLVHYRAFS